MISITEIEQMSRDAYERGKRDGAAQERERLDALLEEEMNARAGSRWPEDSAIILVCQELREAIREAVDENSSPPD